MDGEAPRPAQLQLEEERVRAVSASEGEGGSSPVSPVEEAPGKIPLVPRGFDEIAPFYDELDSLVSGRRAEPVRVLWLGDSHTAADFMTHPVRQRLAEVAGDGGPGFIPIGLSQIRHGSAKIDRSGKWRSRPLAPSQRTRVLDGVFGYGGQRALPASGAEVRVDVRGIAPEEELRWTLSSRLAQGAELTVQLGGKSFRVRSRTGAGEPPRIQQDSFTDKAQASFRLQHRAGDPEVFGVFVEKVRPGVVLDTSGINGARLATTLAWEEEQYVRELEARSPDLVVLAYGTNEAFDDTAPERYAEHYRALWRRIQRAAPAASCWIVGPPDAATKDGRSLTRVLAVTKVQREVAFELGCAFSSAQAEMGGEGSFMRWMHASPPGARSDRVHLTISGYEKLGAALALALLPRAPQ